MRRVVSVYPFGPGQRDGFQPLAAHNRPQPGAGGDAPLIVDDAGDQGEVLASLPDAGHCRLLLARMGRLDSFFGFHSVLAP